MHLDYICGSSSFIPVLLVAVSRYREMTQLHLSLLGRWSCSAVRGGKIMELKVYQPLVIKSLTHHSYHIVTHVNDKYKTILRADIKHQGIGSHFRPAHH